MHALVLGGCGFIGSHIVDVLLDAGHSVRIFGHSPDRFRPPVGAVEYCCADFNNHNELAGALKDVDIVYHALGSTYPESSNFDPEADVQVNLIGTLRLLNLMRSESIRRIVFLSSGGTIYGCPEVVPVPEEHVLNPLCSYGVVKLAIEKYLNMYRQLYDFEPVILRASNPYGPRQGHEGRQGVISTFLHALAEHRSLEVWGDGSVIRDYFHVKDLARLCVQAGGSRIVGTFNAGSGVGISVNQIISTISKVLDLRPSVLYKPGRPYDIPEIALDISKARETFGWVPEISLEQGIHEVWDRVIQHSENP